MWQWYITLIPRQYDEITNDNKEQSLQWPKWMVGWRWSNRNTWKLSITYHISTASHFGAIFRCYNWSKVQHSPKWDILIILLVTSCDYHFVINFWSHKLPFYYNEIRTDVTMKSPFNFQTTVILRPYMWSLHDRCILTNRDMTSLWCYFGSSNKILVTLEVIGHSNFLEKSKNGSHWRVNRLTHWNCTSWLVKNQ